MKAYHTLLCCCLFLFVFPIYSYCDITTDKGCPTIHSQLKSLNKYWNAFEVDESILSERRCFDSHEDLIQLHLSLVEKHLRNYNAKLLSKEQLAKRTQGLDILSGYWKTKRFPKNTKHPGQVIPYFIDQYNTACAVGHILRETGEVALVEEISRKNNYDYIEDMDYPELLEWATEYGFELEELKWIQPSYCDINGTLTFENTPLGELERSICFRQWLGSLPSVIQENNNRYLEFSTKDHLVLEQSGSFFQNERLSFKVRIEENKKAIVSVSHNPFLHAFRFDFMGNGIGTFSRTGQLIEFSYPTNTFFEVTIEGFEEKDLLNVYVKGKKVFEGILSETFDPVFYSGSLSIFTFQSPNSDYEFDIDDFSRIPIFDDPCPQDYFISTPTYKSIATSTCTDCQHVVEYELDNGFSYYLHESTCDVPDWGFQTLYDCRGGRLGNCETTIAGINCLGFDIEEFLQNATFKQVVWTCGNETTFCDVVCDSYSCSDPDFNGQILGTLSDSNCSPTNSFPNNACGWTFESDDIFYHYEDSGKHFIQFNADEDLQLLVVSSCDENANCLGFLNIEEEVILDFPEGGAYLVVDSKGTSEASFEINFLKAESIQETLCSNETYEFFDDTLEGPGIYNHIVENSQGCMEMVQLELKVKNYFQDYNEITLCIDDSLEINGQVISHNEETTYYDLYDIEYTDDDGCLVANTFSVQWGEEDIEKSNSYFLCNGESIIWRGIEYSDEGTYTDIVELTETCDSVYRLNIFVGEPKISELDTSIVIGTYFQGVLILEDTSFIRTGISNYGCENTTTFNISTVTSTQEISKSSVVSIFPNPVNAPLNITLEHSSSIEVNVFSMLGQQVFRKGFEHKANEFQLDLGALNSGTYLLQLVLESEIFIEKIIVL